MWAWIVSHKIIAISVASVIVAGSTLGIVLPIALHEHSYKTEWSTDAQNHWHDAECKTLEECRARVNMRKQEKSKKANKSSQKSQKTVEAEVPKYADFNSEDALLRALERSYGDEKKGD